jgi:hypothetical protein
MSYHADFWVTAGTVAPVIILALVVSSGEGLSIRASITQRPPVNIKNPQVLAITTLILTYVDYSLTGAALFASLISLANERDQLPPNSVVWLLAYGLGGLVVITFMNAVLRASSRKRSPANSGKDGTDTD